MDAVSERLVDILDFLGEAGKGLQFAGDGCDHLGVDAFLDGAVPLEGRLAVEACVPNQEYRLPALKVDWHGARVSISSDAVCFRIEPSRSAEAAYKLFAGALLYTVIVCDRYSAYKQLVSLLGGLVVLAFCWSHVRRDFIECAAGQVKLTRWCQGWIERIAEIYRLNEVRLEHYDPGLKRQTPAFDATQAALMEALDGLFADAREELAALPDQAREGKALRSLLNHREGLRVFVGRPQTPMDNNRAERFLRGPGIGRGLSLAPTARRAPSSRRSCTRCWARSR